MLQMLEDTEEKKPNRRVPDHSTSLSPDYWHRKTGTFRGMRLDVDRSRSVRNVRMEDQTPRGHWETAYYQCQMSCTYCRYLPCFCIPSLTRTAVHPYNIRTVHELVPDDAYVYSVNEFGTVGRRSFVYSKGFIHVRIVLHYHWYHQNSQRTYVID
jgi:hypothetical protein